MERQAENFEGVEEKIPSPKVYSENSSDDYYSERSGEDDVGGDSSPSTSIKKVYAGYKKTLKPKTLYQMS